MTWRVLNISVSPELLEAWRSFLAPQRQPFFMTETEATGLNLSSMARAEAGLTDIERDTFTTWRIPPQADRVVWLSSAAFEVLSQRTQRELLRVQVRHKRGNVPVGRHYADLLPGLPAGRFLWRPEHLTPEVLARLIAQDAQACQRKQVPQSVWDAARQVLPRVRELVSTFPTGSAGNCFGTVMGAAGVAGAENEWMQREPFEEFLNHRATRGGQDDQAGTILLWRSADGLAQHAAVTLGSGWAFQKPSQTWWTPRVVLPTRELIAANRTKGWQISRYTLR